MRVKRIGVAAVVFAMGGSAALVMAEARRSTTVSEIETSIAEALSSIERAQTRGAQIESEVSGLSAKRDEAKARPISVKVEG